MSHFDIPAYLKFLSEPLLAELERHAETVSEVPGLRVARGLREQFPKLESAYALEFVAELYQSVKGMLSTILQQRIDDRTFIDAETLRCQERNRDRSYLAADYETVLLKRDKRGRVVVGPMERRAADKPKAVEIPDFMRGIQVTLFGPPDTRRMSINAMNALHRRLPNEKPIVERLVRESGEVPRWGADDEDSKTPIMTNFLMACENLTGCFDRSLTFEDATTGRTYALEKTGLALPIKRIPGLALPDGNHLLQGNPLPLHLVDLALHLYHNWNRPESLVFYVPKLENEEEARYVKHLISVAEDGLIQRFPTYKKGTVRVLVVFESPRSIFRITEIAVALAPYFVGGSLGWHDFLASTARIFRFDPNYRIPVKANPHIVINHIKESHQILVRHLEQLRAIKIGGMYGVLYEDGNEESFIVSMVGFVKDVVTQLKRGLDGFWVAHPNFVRIGIALVEAWKRQESIAGDQSLDALITALVPDPTESQPLLQFVHGNDVPGLQESSPLYLRSVLAADMEQSDVIANNHPEEIRYNVFQALQYLADWLSGNGCVALPATMKNASGQPVFVRVMDDLATTERSRWELWAEIFHGRVARDDFEAILREEIAFIQSGGNSDTRRVQVKWQGEAEKWYPIGINILHQLVVDPDPVEFVTELLLPFTFDAVRKSKNPWRTVRALCPGRYLDAWITI